MRAASRHAGLPVTTKRTSGTSLSLAGLDSASATGRASRKHLLVPLILGILAGTPCASEQPRSPAGPLAPFLARMDKAGSEASVRCALLDRRLLVGGAFQTSSGTEKRCLERAGSADSIDPWFPLGGRQSNDRALISTVHFHGKVLAGRSFTKHRRARRIGPGHLRRRGGPSLKELSTAHRDSVSSLQIRPLPARAKLCRYGCPPPHREP